MKTHGISENLRAIFLLFGIVFYLFWYVVGFFSSLNWYSHGMIEGQNISWGIGLLANSAILLCGYFLARRISPLSRRPLLVIAFSIIAATGIALVSIALNVNAQAGLLIAGCILTGLGAGPLALCWRECTEDIVSKQAQRALFSFAMMLNALLYLLLISLPFAISVVVCTVSPILSAVFFLCSYVPRMNDEGDASAVLKASMTDVGERKIAATGDGSCRRTPFSGRSFVVLLLCFILLFFPAGVIRTGFLPVATQWTWTLIVSSSAFVIIIVMVLEFFIRQGLHGRDVASLFFPLMVILFLAMPFFTYQDVSLSHFFSYSGCFLLIIYLYSELDAVRSSGYLPIQLFALGMIASNVGCILGICFQNIRGSSFPWNMVSIACLVVAAGLCVYRAVRYPSKDIERFPVPNGEQGAGDPFRIFAESRLDMIDSISHQCHRAAVFYSLSSREEEVLLYLVRGKSAKSIADRTCISYNTVKTHMGHIYQKIDVHTREELIKTVESLPSDRG